MWTNVLIASFLVDTLANNELEELLRDRITSLNDWKLVAQKCSLRAERSYVIMKSDEQQITIVCWSDVLFSS
jgi:hypothetical protein